MIDSIQGIFRYSFAIVITIAFIAMIVYFLTGLKSKNYIKAKIFKIVVIISFLLIVFNIIVTHVYNKFYLNGNNLEFSKVEIGINNNYVPIDIPEGVFVEIININRFSNGDNYTYTYRYYDKYGKLIE